LTIALFIAQFSFLIGSLVNQHPLVCFIVAITTHYGFLAAFSWMNVIAFDLYRNFSNRSSHILLSTVNINRRILKYALCAWFGPLVFVAICMILDLQLNVDFKKSVFKPCYAGYLANCKDDVYFHTNPNSKSMSAYNMNGQGICMTEATRPSIDSTFMDTMSYCWIKNGNAALLFFGAPIGAIIIVNSILFLLTILNIRAKRRRQKLRRTRSTTSTDVNFFIRIAMIMGFTWTIGFFFGMFTHKNESSVIVNEILNYLFVLCNTSTGLFIFVLFILKQDVKNLYMQLLRSKINQIKTKIQCPTENRVLKAKTSAPVDSVNRQTGIDVFTILPDN
jgi:hypothetical protein